MEKLSFRQVHLDFHTSEEIKGIGSQFSKAQFQEMLKKGHLSSITVFAKCHHGWAYHPTKANEIHPNLSFDLLGQMIEAAHEINVKTPVYISAGLDEKCAKKRPEWLRRMRNQSTAWAPDFLIPGYHEFCMNTPYLDYLICQVEEVVKNYDADGIFLDIVGVRTCWCSSCMETMRKEGINPENYDEVNKLGEKIYANYTNKINNTIWAIKPGMRIFHNGGHIVRGRRDLAHFDTHLELESLPTGGWGYDHFPLSAAYASTLGMEYMGMTGKFHTSWGEFGGYKHPNALIYETALSLAFGARCSIGDQLPPSGLMDNATYSLIGKAYKQVEEKEKWCFGTELLADVGLLSLESISNRADRGNNSQSSDAGAVRMLLEGKFLFKVIDTEEDFSKYKVLVLPDDVRVNEKLSSKIKDFVDNGGQVLATGDSGLKNGEDKFALDFGLDFVCKNEYKPDYFRPSFKMENLENAVFIFYSEGNKINLKEGTELGRREDPYFNRTYAHFCSHQHSPSSGNYGGPGMVKGKDGIYIAWKIFEDYATKGSLILKETFVYALNMLLGNDKTLECDLPAQGVVTLNLQAAENRKICHLLYVSPVKRGNGIEIIEDILALYDITVRIKAETKPSKVYLAPQMEDLEFKYDKGKLSFKLNKLYCHQMAVIE